MNADQEQKDMQQALERFGSYMRYRQFLLPLGERVVVTRAADVSKRRMGGADFLKRARNAADPWRAAALASTARTILHPIAPPDARTWGLLLDAITTYDASLSRALRRSDARAEVLATAHAAPVNFPLGACPAHLDPSHAAAVPFIEPLLPCGRNLDSRDLGLFL